MKSIVKYIVTLIILFAIPIIYAYADYECYYNVSYPASGCAGGSVDKTASFEIITSGSKPKIDRISESKDYSNYEFIDESIINQFASDKYTYTSSYIDEYLEKLGGECPDRIYVCQFARGEYLTAYGFIIDASLYAALPQTGTHSMKVGKENWFITINNCQIGIYDKKKSTSSSTKVDIDCAYYKKLVYGTDGLAKRYCNIGDSDCTVERLNGYNEKRDELISWCRSLLSFSNYLDPCLTACNDLSKDLAVIEGKMLKGECGFSFQIIVWVNNIMKWIKYILPVLVVIFGIIDFIKAMSASNDDEMKKAQKHFVTRLIAAALVFIVPLIISFILTKMGFTPEACGIDVLK